MFTIRFSRSNRSVLCPPSQTILEAAQAGGIEMPFSCQGGTCHTCAQKAEGEMDCEEMLALSAEELQAGWRLICVGKPRGNCTIDF